METNTAASRTPTVLSLLGALLILLIGGWLVGMAAVVVGSFCYLVLVFPVAMGAAGGKIAGKAVEVGRIRQAKQAILLSVLTALVIYGTFHYGRYVVLQLQTVLAVAPEVPETSTVEKLQLAKILVDYGLEEETGYPGFIGFMLYKADAGFSIGRFYGQNRLELTSSLAWLYWLLELGVIVWITVSMGRKQLSVPHCEACGSRYGREKHLGGTSLSNEPVLLDLIRRNDLVELGKLIEKDAGLPSVELYLQTCDCGESTSFITVRRASLGARGSVLLSDISRAAWKPGDSTLFLQQLRFEVE